MNGKVAIELKSEDTINERKQLEQAIAALEAQRTVLGDAVVDTAVGPLKQKLEDLAAADRPAASERRIVTVLFCDTVGSTTLAEQLDPETWTGIMNRVFPLLIEPVDRYGGTVTRLMGDAILALFGAPESHEDDPERAILAGLSILENTRSFRRQIMEESGMAFDFRVGINTGLAVVGEVGSKLLVEYTAMGDAVNVAARMEQTAAPGVVQISEPTYQLVSDLFEVEPLGPISVKGREAPMEAYQVVGRKARTRRTEEDGRARLVGRHKDMARLRQFVTEVRGGRGQIVLMLGEAGLGKSRLIAELRGAWLAEHRLDAGDEDPGLPRWTEMSATSYSTGRPYGTFENQMRIIAGIAPTDPTPEAREKLRQILAADPEHEFLQSVYERLLGIHAEDDASPSVAADLSSEAFMRALYDSTLKAIRNETGGRPSVIVFDDLQWVDPASLGLIEHAMQLVSELPLLGYSEFTLDPLSGEESVELADALVTVETVPEGLRQLVLDKAEGNPFYIEELMQMLLDRGLLASPASDSGLSEWELGEAGDVPANLLSLVATRVDRLPRDVRLTLQLAAVIGRSFYVRVLRQISEAQAELESHLRQLETAEMIRESTRQPEWEYIFRHALTQEAVYSTLLLEQRRRFHEAVGQTLEQLYPERLDEFAPVLAHHFDEGRQLKKARHYYILAGNEAALLHANEQAVDYYRRALTIAQAQEAGSKLIIDLYGRLGRVLEHLNRYDEAIRLYIELENLGQKQGDQAMVLTSLTSRTILYANPTSIYDVDKAEALAAEALGLASEMGDQAAETQIYMQITTLNSFKGNFEEALSSGDRAIAQARDLGDRLLLAHVLNDLSSHLYAVMGELERATAALLEARQLWRELGDKAMETDSLSTLAEVSIYTGDFDQALSFAKEARTISRSIHNLWGESHSQFMVGHAYWEWGRPDRAIATMEESIRLGEAAGFMVPQVGTRCELALIYANLGDAKLALDLFDTAQKLAGQFAPLKVYLAGLLAQVQVISGDLQAAEATVDIFGDRLKGSLKSAFDTSGFQGMVDIALGQGRPRQALSVVGHLLVFVRKIGARPYQMQALVQQARALQDLDRPAEALASLEEAQALGEAMGSRWMMWQIEAELGNLAEDSAEAQAHFRRASDLIHSIHNHTPEHLRDSFFSRTDVQALLATDDHSQ
jgi:class 3 adenylate cyclase/tetratricopeptide (TPR) repeat protein